MKYTIRKDADGYKLLRYGEPVTGKVNNAELEFWLEIERLTDGIAALVTAWDRVGNDPDASPDWAAACIACAAQLELIVTERTAK